jgi:hypothetical protein
MACIVVMASLAGPPEVLAQEEPPKAPVPSSPFAGIVYRYADAMLGKGRDELGRERSGLFLSALDRTGPAPLDDRPPAPRGVPEESRAGAPGVPLRGANLQHDHDLLRLLYTLSELSGSAAYRDAADAALRWFLEKTPSSETHLLPWGERLSWDVAEDTFAAGDGATGGTHGFFGPWLLWERCFDLAPAASARFALGLWEHQIADRRTGAFDRHAGFSTSSPRDGIDSPRHAGFYIRTWAVAYRRTREARFANAIETLLERYEKKRHAATGLIPSGGNAAEAAPASSLSLAIDCDGAAHHVPEPLAARLRAFASREDAVFCALPHDLREHGGFLTAVDAAGGRPSGPRTPLWDPAAASGTTAQVAMMCVSRYENTAKVAYRELIHAAADLYLESLPAAEVDAWPGTFGQAISLELAAWRSTARPAYLERARELGDRAAASFFDGSPLPRASLKSGHYESITGGPSLALGLLELHLHILYITAVRWQPNTAAR